MTKPTIPSLLLLLACAQALDARQPPRSRKPRSRRLQETDWTVPVPTASPTPIGGGFGEAFGEPLEADPTGGADEGAEEFDAEDPNAPAGEGAAVTASTAAAEGEGAPDDSEFGEGAPVQTETAPSSTAAESGSEGVYSPYPESGADDAAASNATVAPETVDFDADEISEPETLDLDESAQDANMTGFDAQDVNSTGLDSAEANSTPTNLSETTRPSSDQEEQQHAETIDLDANQDTTNATDSAGSASVEGFGTAQSESTRPAQEGINDTNAAEIQTFATNPGTDSSPTTATTEATRPSEGESPAAESSEGQGDDRYSQPPADDRNETDDWEGEGEDYAWEARAPTPEPTPRPTYEYVSSADDMLASNEIDPTSFDDAVTVEEKFKAYLEGVESAEEMEEDRNVQVAAGVLTGVFVVLWLITAWQTMENPDGLCASFCRLTLKFICCIVRVLFLPCRYVCCKADQARGSRRSHAPMRSGRASFPSDLELS